VVRGVAMGVARGVPSMLRSSILARGAFLSPGFKN